MKKTLLALIVATLALPSVAANVLVLIPKSGQPTSFELASSPALTFVGTRVVVECNNQQFSYERKYVRSFQFQDQQTTFINNVATEVAEPVNVYASDGRIVLSGSSAEPINLQQLGSGIFIVRQGANTYKVVNK